MTQLQNVTSNNSKPVAVITGASRGIGQALAQLLLQNGYRLGLLSRSRPQWLTTDFDNHQAYWLPCDLRQLEQLPEHLETFYKHFGRLDVLVNNAGLAPRVGLLQEVPLAELNDTLDINLKAPIVLMQQALQLFLQQNEHCHRTILNINSVAGKTAFPYWAIYDASKFGLHAITQAVAQEQQGSGVKVCAVYPGAVNTDIWQGTQKEVDPSGMLTPEAVAQAAWMLLSQPADITVNELTITPTRAAL